MARVAIIADIHGNLEALEAVLGDIDRQRNISRIYSLGDNVGYGPKPVEVLESLEGREIRSLIGNHEAAVMGILDFEERFSSENAVEATRWTIETLEKHKVNLDNSPYFKGAGFAMMPSGLARVGMTHSTLSEPEAFEYLVRPQIADTRALAVREFKYMRRKEIRVMFFGHSHEAMILRADYGIGSVDLTIPNFKNKKRAYTYSHSDEEMWMVNVGSVGQPRDGDPRACYAVYDANRGTMSLYRVEYDVEEASSQIIRAGLPPVYAKRLGTGR
jgi:predicted phosphodiesterase